MSAADPLCLWCGAPFNPRQGGKEQRFCQPACRRALHDRARVWVLREVEAGRIPVVLIRDGSPLLDLPGDGGGDHEGGSPAETPSPRRFAAALDARLRLAVLRRG